MSWLVSPTEHHLHCLKGLDTWIYLFISNLYILVFFVAYIMALLVISLVFFLENLINIIKKLKFFYRFVSFHVILEIDLTSFGIEQLR